MDLLWISDSFLASDRTAVRKEWQQDKGWFSYKLQTEINRCGKLTFKIKNMNSKKSEKLLISSCDGFWVQRVSFDYIMLSKVPFSSLPFLTVLVSVQNIKTLCEKLFKLLFPGIF